MPGGPEGIPARFLSCPRPRAICPGVARLAKLAAGNRTRVATMMRSARLILAAVACMVVESRAVLGYLPVLMISAVITGTLTGIAAKYAIAALQKAGLGK